MLIPPLPDNEQERLNELLSLNILDTPAEEGYENISELARRCADADISLISLVDQDRQWFKSCVGLELEQPQTPRSISFCGHAILQRCPLIVCNALDDPRFADNPLVIAEPGIRFYAGFPLVTSRGLALGTLCVIKREPHTISEEQIDSLRRLSSLTVERLEFQRALAMSTGKPKIFASKLSEQLVPRDELDSLAQLQTREQLMRMVELAMDMEVDSSFSLLRCSFGDYDRINASFGSSVAEEYINEGARRLLASAPRGSSLARISEEEILILVPFDAARDRLQQAAERIIAFTAQPHQAGTTSLAMSVTIGIAIFRRNYDSIESMLADSALAVRMAQRSAVSDFRFVDDDMRVSAKATLCLESDLRDALVKGQMEPYLQPIVALDTSDIIGFEALARWQRDQELISPATFVPVLAEAGLVGELDLLIAQKAMTAATLLAMAVPQKPMTLSVNLSGTTLEDERLRHSFLSLVDRTPLPPGWVLQVELVEDAFQSATPTFDAFLDSLSKRSVQIAIDDFGTGYSSLSRLISLPIQEVKVDQVFIQRLDQPAESPRTLLRTMLGMMDDLGMAVTAEGVETTAQQRWLLDQGVGKGQGYLFHQPLPLSAAIDLLKSLNYRPGAIPVPAAALGQVRRKRRRDALLRLPFLNRRRSDR